jgi:hypothetical protein
VTYFTLRNFFLIDIAQEMGKVLVAQCGPMNVLLPPFWIFGGPRASSILPIGDADIFIRMDEKF